MKQKEKLVFEGQVFGTVVLVEIIERDDLFGNIKNSLNKTVF